MILPSDVAEPGDVAAETPTLKCLGVRWLIAGYVILAQNHNYVTFVVDRRPDFCYTDSRKGMINDGGLGVTKSEFSVVRPMRRLRRVVSYKGDRDGPPGTGYRPPG